MALHTVSSINRLTEPFRLSKVAQAVIIDKSKAIRQDYMDEQQRFREEMKKTRDASKPPKVDEFNKFQSALKVVDEFVTRFTSNVNHDLQTSWQYQEAREKSRTDWREKFDFAPKEKEINDRRNERNKKLDNFIVSLRQKMLADATKKAKALTDAEQKALDAI